MMDALAHFNAACASPPRRREFENGADELLMYTSFSSSSSSSPSSSLVTRRWSSFSRRHTLKAVGVCVAVVLLVAAVTYSTSATNAQPTLGGDTTTKTRKKKVSRSTRAGLSFPVGRIARHLRKGKYANRVSTSAAVMMAAVTEYLTAEVLELAGNAATVARKARIIPRHIFLGIKTDEELSKHLDKIIFHEGGVLPQLVAPPKSKKKKEVAPTEA
mmetsp:Transcript_24137/g.58345  ORF Transcript_24137/g.58345 Transcript_24137/m.58345 type:complete len:216 (-) Transcript_24137:285-932(-)